MALFLNLIFTYFPLTSNSGKFKEISSTIFYCIIPPQAKVWSILLSTADINAGTIVYTTDMFTKYMFVLKSVKYHQITPRNQRFACELQLFRGLSTCQVSQKKIHFPKLRPCFLQFTGVRVEENFNIRNMHNSFV